MNSSSPTRPLAGFAGRGRTGRLGLLIATIVSILGIAAMSASSATAEEVTFTFDSGRINLGTDPGMQGLPIIDPTSEDEAATLTGDVDEFGQFTADPSGFYFPPKVLPEAVSSPLLVDVIAEFDAIGEITGTVDRETGDLFIDNMNLAAKISAYASPVGPSPNPAAALGICGVSPIPLPLNTGTDLVNNADPENPITYEGSPFDPTGAAAATWASLPSSTVLGGLAPALVCPQINTLLGGPGGLWLAGESTAYIPPPPGPREVTFTFDDGRINLGDQDPGMQGLRIIDPSAGDEAATLTGEVDEFGQFTADPSGFYFPPKVLSEAVTDPLTADVIAEFDAVGEITGTFDQETGDLFIDNMQLAAKISAYVSPVVMPPNPATALGICSVSPIDLPLSTTTDLVSVTDDGTTVYESSGFDPTGAAGATWDSLPSATVVGGLAPALVCPAVNDLLAGPGGLWLSGYEGEKTETPQEAPEITAQPPAETESTTAEFGFTEGAGETREVTGFDCRVDPGGTWQACDSGTVTYENLTPGSKTFRVRATNEFGFGPEATYQWLITVAPTAPQVAPAISSGPTGTTNQATAQLTFAAGAGETAEVDGFECKLEGGSGSGAFEACTSPKSYTSLADGSYTFTVRAVNSIGAGPEATRQWTVDTTPPIVAPTAAPKVNQTPDAVTTQTGATFGFAQGDGETQPVTGFECKLDGGAFEACASPKSYAGLGVGSHSFAVKAVNAIGSGPETTYEWEIKSAVQPKPAFGPLKVTPKSKAVKRGKKVVFTAKIKNTGSATANGVKVCVKAPAKVVSVKKCVAVGKVAAGKTGTAKFRVTVKKKAKGKKANLAFTATANGVAKKTAKATVKVKK